MSLHCPVSLACEPPHSSLTLAQWDVLPLCQYCNTTLSIAMPDTQACPKMGRLISTAVWIVPGTACYHWSQRSALTTCNNCRQKRMACLLQHWHSWAAERGRSRQLGQMVHRGHQGFAMRHAWEHWHWIASCKVGPLGEPVEESSGKSVNFGFA